MARTLAGRQTGRHERDSAERIRCGDADPRVSAPTMIPRASPRPRANHVVITFMPTGYTPANATPVKKRSTRALPKPSLNTATPAFSAAPVTAAAAITTCGATRSARLSTADVTAPATNPSWTDVVSRLSPVPVSPHSRESDPLTAEAENHIDIANTCTSAMYHSCRRAIIDPPSRTPCGLDSRPRRPAAG